ncbi:TolC family outer membrane protein [Pseudogulbenkiania sp. MAI-1]|uniref:TolC family outer membrane protein n=1 Tax=Pseudogulbenkiania sp. MAI-1 TaxID=990370 RepID=UPI00045E61CD|nr:TolC family outer membrane protein [Pseudogulbenkiania sp. MAI-1]
MSNKYPVLRISIALALACAVSHQALAIELKDAVEKAIVNNPEVRLKWHQFRGAGEDVGVGRAGFLPSVDLSYEATRQRFDYAPSSTSDQRYTTRGWTATLTQNLFQGFQTYNTVKQLGYDQQARYFDFLEASESMALQVTQAYADVLRYRQLVEFAQENYATHKGIYDQIQKKVQAGAGRRVDFEQAAGRLALAESNLITETSNLHDVSVRYSRLVGIEPPAQLSPLPGWQTALPKGPDLLASAVGRSPAYLSALSTVRSARSEVSARRGAFSPTLDLRASKGYTNDYEDISGQTRRSSVGLVFNVNLFRGGADRARLGSSAEKLNTTLDLRDKVCRDLRQTVRIAYNNVVKLQDQMNSLRQHQLSTEKAREAYRKQFDIGQRTLLDVLDSENELYDAKRAYVNAQMDHTTAQASVLANSGRLLETLRLKPIEEYETKDGLSAEERGACDTAYTPPPAVDVNAIQPRPYVAATADVELPAAEAPKPAEPVKSVKPVKPAAKPASAPAKP